MYHDLHVLQSKNLQEMIDKLAKIPLLYQPGTGLDLQHVDGYPGLHRREALRPVAAGLHARPIFEPLGMRDAGFYVPEDKRNRFASLYEADPQGNLVLTPGCCGTGDYASRPPCLPAAVAWFQPRRTIFDSPKCWLGAAI